jgi:hypothetical protein
MTQVKHVKSAVLVDDEDSVVTEIPLGVDVPEGKTLNISWTFLPLTSEQLKSIAQQTEVDDL